MIAAAVAEQHAVTSQISSSVERAAAATDGVAEVAERSNGAATETDQASAAVVAAVELVKSATERLNQRIDRFMSELAA